MARGQGIWHYSTADQVIQYLSALQSQYQLVITINDRHVVRAVLEVDQGANFVYDCIGCETIDLRIN